MVGLHSKLMGRARGADVGDLEGNLSGSVQPASHGARAVLRMVIVHTHQMEMHTSASYKRSAGRPREVNQLTLFGRGMQPIVVGCHLVAAPIG